MLFVYFITLAGLAISGLADIIIATEVTRYVLCGFAFVTLIEIAIYYHTYSKEVDTDIENYTRQEKEKVNDFSIEKNGKFFDVKQN